MGENKNIDAAGEQASSLPRHIAIILDGNGRWAKKRLMPRNAGHLAGSETFRNIATYCKKIGVEYLTVYAFSTENWKRPEEEVGGIMKLLDKYLHEAIRDMRKKNIRMRYLEISRAFRRSFRNSSPRPTRYRRQSRAFRQISA